MTTNAIIAAARRKLLETGVELITDAVLLEYANEAYKDVWKELFVSSNVTTATIVCTAGICTLPATYGRMYTEAIDVSNNLYPEVSIADYDGGNFERAFTIKNGSLTVSNTIISSLIIKYYPAPLTLTASQNPTTDSYFDELIIYGTLAREYEDLQDEELSNYFWTRFDTMLARKTAKQSTYEESNQTGGEMFSYQALI